MQTQTTTTISVQTPVGNDGFGRRLLDSFLESVLLRSLARNVFRGARTLYVIKSLEFIMLNIRPGRRCGLHGNSAKFDRDLSFGSECRRRCLKDFSKVAGLCKSKRRAHHCGAGTFAEGNRVGRSFESPISLLECLPGPTISPSLPSIYPFNYPTPHPFPLLLPPSFPPDHITYTLSTTKTFPTKKNNVGE